MADEKKGSAKALFWAAAGGLATAAGAWLWDKGLSALWDVLAGAWAHLFQSTTASNWQWYSLAALSVHSVMYWAWRLMPAKTFSHSRFTEDNFLGAKWRWMYDTSGRPYNFVPYCGHCDALLVYSRWLDENGMDRTDLHCEHCRTMVGSEMGDKNYVWARAARHVDRLVRTGEWQRRPGMEAPVK